jgi:hypothetical protein
MIPFICIEILVLKKKFEDTKVVHGRMTDNSMTEIKWTKGQTKIYKTVHQKNTYSLKTGCVLRCSGRENSSCSTGGTRRAPLVTIQ